MLGVYSYYDTLYSEIFMSSIIFFVLMLCLTIVFTQYRKGTRVRHEEFVLISRGPVPGYMSIHPVDQSRAAPPTYHVYPVPRTGLHDTVTMHNSRLYPPPYQALQFTRPLDSRNLPQKPSIVEGNADTVINKGASNITPAITGSDAVADNGCDKDSKTTNETQDDAGTPTSLKTSYSIDQPTKTMKKSVTSNEFSDDEVFYDSSHVEGTQEEKEKK